MGLYLALKNRHEKSVAQFKKDWNEAINSFKEVKYAFKPTQKKSFRELANEELKSLGVDESELHPITQSNTCPKCNSTRIKKSNLGLRCMWVGCGAWFIAVICLMFIVTFPLAIVWGIVAGLLWLFSIPLLFVREKKCKECNNIWV